MMAAIALVGCGAMSNTVVPSIRVEAASVQNADDAVKQLITDQDKAEQNALDYVGFGYTVISSDMICGAENSHSFQVGVAPISNKKEVLYLYVDKFQCMTMDELKNGSFSEEAQFFADKRVAEAAVLKKVGKGFQIISSESIASNSGKNTFKIGVAKNVKSQAIYFYAGKDFCMTEKGWTAPAASNKNSQNPIMNFIGKYGNGRATMTVSAKGSDKAVINVTWSSSAFEHSEWTMSGDVSAIGDCVTVDYEDCFKETFGYDTNGALVKDIIEYTGGEGKLTFHNDSVTWDDGMENIADGAVFTYCK